MVMGPRCHGGQRDEARAPAFRQARWNLRAREELGHHRLVEAGDGDDLLDQAVGSHRGQGHHGALDQLGVDAEISQSSILVR